MHTLHDQSNERGNHITTIVMKTTATILRELQDRTHVLYEIAHEAIKKIRPDLYRNGAKPELRFSNVSPTGFATITESNNKLTMISSPKNAGIRYDLRNGSASVVDVDMVPTPASSLVTESAVRRPRKLGRWD